jgi:hypothetical protein
MERSFFLCPQRQQSMAGAASKRLLQPGALRRFKRLLVSSQRQDAVRRENWYQHCILRIDATFL